MTKSVLRRHVVMAIASPLVFAVLAGCATTGTTSVPAENDRVALQKRAQAYWDLVRVKDSVGAWAYEVVSKDQSMTLEAYIKRGGIAYDAVEVRNVRSMEADDAVLDVWMRYGIPMLRLKSQEALVQDHWRKIDGVWHHVLRRSSTIPDAKP